MNEPLSKSQLARKLDIPLPRLSHVLAVHGIEPTIRRANLELFAPSTLDTVRAILAGDNIRSLTAAVQTNVPEFIG